MIWLWRKDSNLRMAALTVRCLTSLATPQKNDEGDKGEIVKRAAVDDTVTSMRITSFPVAVSLSLLPFSIVTWLREQESNLPNVAYETTEPPLLYSRISI